MTTETTPAGAAAPAPEKTVAPTQADPAPADPNSESATSDNPGPDPTDTAEPASKDAAAAPEADKPKEPPAATPEKTPPAEKRIAKLTARLREAERRLEAAEAAKTADKGGQGDNAAGGDKPPTPDQFKTWDEYEEAKTRFLVEKTTRDQETKRQRETAEKQWTETREGFLAGVPKAAETYPDFEEVVMDPDGVFDRTPAGEALASMVMLAEKAHDVAYHLASNPKEAERIKALNPIQAALAIGRLSASIAQPATRTVPKAPDPPPIVRGGDTPTKDPAKMTMAEYEAWRMGKTKRA